MTWEVFHAKVLRYLESAAGKVELTCKVSGDTGKAGQMKGEEDYKSALERVHQRAQNARTRAVSLEIKNIAKQDAPKPNSKKQTRKDDVPPSVDHVDSETSTQFKSFEQLEAATRCESHHGHCFVSRTGGFDNHHRLDHSEMTLWAKKISLGQATIYNPPHCLNFDIGPSRLSTGRAWPVWPWGRPGPATQGPGSGQRFSGPGPKWRGQGQRSFKVALRVGPRVDPARPSPNMTIHLHK
ncbi:hypothetical protein JOM56_001918 [Amanita muscaria]